MIGYLRSVILAVVAFSGLHAAAAEGRDQTLSCFIGMLGPLIANSPVPDMRVVESSVEFSPCWFSECYKVKFQLTDPQGNQFSGYSEIDIDVIDKSNPRTGAFISRELSCSLHLETRFNKFLLEDVPINTSLKIINRTGRTVIHKYHVDR